MRASKYVRLKTSSLGVDTQTWLEEALREFEVLKVMAELTSKKENVCTGLVEEAVKKKGLMVCGRILEYYLSDLARRNFIRLKEIRIGKGHSTKIELAISKERESLS